MERNWSLADHAVAVISEIERMLDGVTNEHPMRYSLRRMKGAASKAAFDGLRTAADICEAVRILRETENTDSALIRAALEAAVAWSDTAQGRDVPQVDGQPGEWIQAAREALKTPNV